MVPQAGNAVFVDTNILVYASFPGSAFHAAARTRLSELEANHIEFWTSRQVLREFLAVATRPGAVLPAPGFDELALAVRRFESAFRIANEDAAVTGFLLDLLASNSVQGKQIHDANIVATMIRNGIPWLLTHNTADFERFVPKINLCGLQV